MPDPIAADADLGNRADRVKSIVQLVDLGSCDDGRRADGLVHLEPTGTVIATSARDPMGAPRQFAFDAARPVISSVHPDGALPLAADLSEVLQQFAVGVHACIFLVGNEGWKLRPRDIAEGLVSKIARFCWGCLRRQQQAEGGERRLSVQYVHCPPERHAPPPGFSEGGAGSVGAPYVDLLGDAAPQPGAQRPAAPISLAGRYSEPLFRGARSVDIVRADDAADAVALGLHRRAAFAADPWFFDSADVFVIECRQRGDGPGAEELLSRLHIVDLPSYCGSGMGAGLASFYLLVDDVLDAHRAGHAHIPSVSAHTTPVNSVIAQEGLFGGSCATALVTLVEEGVLQYDHLCRLLDKAAEARTCLATPLVNDPPALLFTERVRLRAAELCDRATRGGGVVPMADFEKSQLRSEAAQQRLRHELELLRGRCERMKEDAVAGERERVELARQLIALRDRDMLRGGRLGKANRELTERLAAAEKQLTRLDARGEHPPPPPPSAQQGPRRGEGDNVLSGSMTLKDLEEEYVALRANYLQLQRSYRELEQQQQQQQSSRAASPAPPPAPADDSRYRRLEEQHRELERNYRELEQRLSAPAPDDGRYRRLESQHRELEQSYRQLEQRVAALQTAPRRADSAPAADAAAAPQRGPAVDRAPADPAGAKQAWRLRELEGLYSDLQRNHSELQSAHARLEARCAELTAAAASQQPPPRPPAAAPAAPPPPPAGWGPPPGATGGAADPGELSALRGQLEAAQRAAQGEQTERQELLRRLQAAEEAERSALLAAQKKVLDERQRKAGAGPPDAEAVAAAAVAAYDSNGDGALDDEEWAALARALRGCLGGATPRRPQESAGQVLVSPAALAAELRRHGEAHVAEAAQMLRDRAAPGSERWVASEEEAALQELMQLYDDALRRRRGPGGGDHSDALERQLLDQQRRHVKRVATLEKALRGAAGSGGAPAATWEELQAFISGPHAVVVREREELSATNTRLETELELLEERFTMQLANSERERLRLQGDLAKLRSEAQQR